MVVELPSGATVTLRDKISADTKFKVQDAVTLQVDTSTGLQSTSAGLVNKMRNALLAELIESWTVEGHSVPSQDPAALGQLDIDDYLVLAQAVEPVLSKIVTGGVPNQTGPSSS